VSGTAVAEREPPRTRTAQGGGAAASHANPEAGCLWQLRGALVLASWPMYSKWQYSGKLLLVLLYQHMIMVLNVSH
jgi:hypothetical protein